MQLEGRRWQEASLRLLGRPTTQVDYTAAAIVWHIGRLARLNEKRMEYEVHRPLGWTWGAFRIMSQLYVLGPQEPSQLADSLQLTRPTITGGVDRLERDGYVTRTVQPKNRSRLTIDLTEAGKEAVEEAAGLQHQVELDLVSGLSEEDQSQLSELLTKLFNTLQQ
ncbi:MULTISPECIES: MarR family winged helix-turn-helix transcriptional regulator [Rhodococcus]|uniref:MarR family transcriptional regulator n=1 Tax=Rhodococcus pseudokoreensis TaxID=2811421 RepID=A0A974ZRR6_9NOCA|nr:MULTISPECIES: MarR family transcriptional regulator [Rhodococcus]MBV6762286.1 MarR family transcriptional regulator [Rhodococcus opacus]QSE87804.1 MarR family transcriptional regulator [Rhodococcus pseudokoreensis]